MFRPRVVVTLLTLGYVVLPAAQAAPQASIDILPSYSEGDYGTSATTKITYIPVYLKYRADATTLLLTIPYISVTGPGVLLSGGTVIDHQRPPMMSAGGGMMSPAPSATAPSSTQSGLGDIWLGANYRVRGGGRDSAVPDVIPYAQVKFGTASASKGLGTGENDYEGGLGLEWRVTRISPFVSAGYRILGDPPGLDLKNIALYDAGATFHVNDRNDITGEFIGHEAAVSGQASAADAVVTWAYAPMRGRVVRLFLDKGLSDGSPDFAVGAGLEASF